MRTVHKIYQNNKRHNPRVDSQPQLLLYLQLFRSERRISQILLVGHIGLLEQVMFCDGGLDLSHIFSLMEQWHGAGLERSRKRGGQDRNIRETENSILL